MLGIKKLFGTEKILNQVETSDFKATPFADLSVTRDPWNPKGLTDTEIIEDILGPDGDNWAAMKQANLSFAPVEDAGGDPPTQRSAYKLKVAMRDENGTLRVHFRQLASRLGIINGAQSGVKIPDIAKETAFNRGLQYYEKLDIPKEDRPIFTGDIEGYRWLNVTRNKQDNSAEIHIFGIIGDEVTAMDFVGEMKALRGIKRLDIHINSDGGSVFEGFAIANAIQSFPADTVVFIDGIAASMAAVIAVAADKTVIAENGFMMIHNPITFTGGDAEELRKDAGKLDKIRDSLVNAFHKKSGRPKNRIRALMDDETWFNAHEAVEFGLADEIGAFLEIAAKINYAGRLDKIPDGAKLLIHDSYSPNNIPKSKDQPQPDTTGAMDMSPEEIKEKVDAARQEGFDSGKSKAESDLKVKNEADADQAQAKLAELQAKADEANGAVGDMNAKLEAAQARIKDLTVGMNFDSDGSGDGDGEGDGKEQPPKDWNEAMDRMEAKGLKEYEARLEFCMKTYPELHRAFIKFEGKDLLHRH